MLVISQNFDISFKFSVEMRKISTVLDNRGSDRRFEAILCWSLFLVANTYLCGSNFTQIGELSKWKTLFRLSLFKKTSPTICVSHKKCGSKHDILEIEYDYIKLQFTSILELWCGVQYVFDHQHDSDRAFQSAWNSGVLRRLSNPQP